MISADAIVNHLNDPIIILDGQARILFFNKASVRFQHLARKPITEGGSFIELVSPEREEMVKELIQQAYVHQITATVEAEYKDTSGRSHYFEVSYSPIYDEIENEVRVFIAAHEITPQKAFERKSIHMLRDFQYIIENANAMIFAIDSREYITDWNRECTRVTQYEKNEILTHRIANLLDKESKEPFNSLITEVLTGKPAHNYELLIRNKDKARLNLLVNVTPKLNERGDAVGALFVGQDITELSSYRYSLEQQVIDRTEKLKQALEKERELVAIKNRFVSMASHELRSPLSSIEYAVRSIRSGSSLQEGVNPALNKIDKQVEIMKHLLEDILTLEKEDTQKLKPNYESFDLVAFLNELADEVLVSQKQTHRIVKTFSHPFIEMRCDSKLLRNIFINLLNNAIKFSPGHDVVELGVELEDGGWVEIIIRDYGIGIPEEDLKRIFEPFTRGSNTANIKGTGLGMSIVKRAVETLQGTLTLESTIMSGTKATVRLKNKPESKE